MQSLDEVDGGATKASSSHGFFVAQDVDLHIEQAHQTHGPVPKEGAPLRSIIVKFLSCLS